ncbi:hypothetical protein L3Q82_001719 [Scortum barcoo]|uniref:Uncharacterized protein n=1 Tax=Scortum barcoo TaxID=214431 RepID=A0ACB8W4I8_9TELE|nr:hypothetical protein L3Q82_001719 [Scortum barcoo]
MSNRVVCREASHAGTWYSASGSQLNAQLEGWLSKAESTIRPARAIIAPHAGYTYCGACAAHAYKQVDPTVTRRVFILGPSHHVPLSRCALSPADIYRTPLYDLRIDQKVYADLWKTGLFERMSMQTDEDEHSIEMHLPYTAKAMESHKDEFSIVPVLVGALSESKEQEYGKLLSKYLADPSNLFIISSDFCHWGQRFRYTYYDESQGEIYRSIEHLDKMGMGIIEQLDPMSFTNYLKKYRNTICGRHPIGVLLNVSTTEEELSRLVYKREKIIATLTDPETQTCKMHCHGDLINYLSCGMILTAFGYLVHHRKTQTSYGRHMGHSSSDRMVPARLAWFFQELPAVLIPLLLMLTSHKPSGTGKYLLLGTFCMHYFQRTFVYSLLTRGKPFPLGVMAGAGLFCSTNGFLQGHYLLHCAQFDDGWSADYRCKTGLLLFYTGMAINIHSDYILRNLRKPGEEVYRIPAAL